MPTALKPSLTPGRLALRFPVPELPDLFFLPLGLTEFTMVKVKI
jgi:hypothetical protein